NGTVKRLRRRLSWLRQTRCHPLLSTDQGTATMARIRTAWLFGTLALMGGALTGCLPVVAAAILGIVDATQTNATPTVVINPVDRTADPAVLVPLIVFDADGDEVTLQATIHAGAEKIPATIEPTVVAG